MGRYPVLAALVEPCQANGCIGTYELPGAVFGHNDRPVPLEQHPLNRDGRLKHLPQQPLLVHANGVIVLALCEGDQFFVVDVRGDVDSLPTHLLEPCAHSLWIAEVGTQHCFHRPVNGRLNTGARSRDPDDQQANELHQVVKFQAWRQSSVCQDVPHCRGCVSLKPAEDPLNDIGRSFLHVNAIQVLLEASTAGSRRVALPLLSVRHPQETVLRARRGERGQEELRDEMVIAR